MRQFLVYLAGPISGCSFDECTDWRAYVEEKVPKEIIALNPLRGKTYLEGLESIDTHYEEGNKVNEASKYYHLRTVLSSARGITTRDYNDCIRSDALIVNLKGATRVSIGTVMEIAWAKAHNVPVCLVMEESGNVHDHPMITESIGFRVTNIDDAIAVVTMLLLPCSHRAEQK